MYNLLIGLTEGEVRVDRVLEYTSDDVQEYVAHKRATGQTRGELRRDRVLNLPTLLMPEIGSTDVPQTARVGHITNLVKSGRSYTFTFVPNPSISPIPSGRIEEVASALGVVEWELRRTHWAVKDVDLYRVISEQIADIGLKSKVLKMPREEASDPSLVAVMMTFDSVFAPVFASLKQGVEAIGMRCLRADDFWEHDRILDDVLSLIWRARVVVSDLSGKNPNVLYETGIAHTLGRDTILVAQSVDDVPFDLRPIRMLHYLNNDEGLLKLAKEIAERLKTLTAS